LKVKIPKEIKIGARIYKVGFKDNLLRDDANRGQVYWHKQEMELSPNLHPQQLSVTFLHECIHIIDEHIGARIGLTEENTTALSEGLYQLLKDNLDIEFDWSEIYQLGG